MRFDRFLTLAVFQRLQGIGSRGEDACLPILMYHSIAEDLEPGRSPYYKVCTSPKRFAEQMQWLKDNGCRGVTLKEGMVWLGLRPQDRKLQPVCLTFDDGFRDFLTEAWPVLSARGFSATVFLPTQFVGDSRTTFLGRDCLTWDEVRDLRKRGVDFGSHTVTHPKLAELDEAAFERELINSKRAIEEALGEPIDCFSHPYAFPLGDERYVERFRRSLRSCGYATGVTTTLGRAQSSDDVLVLKRLPVNDGDDLKLFCAKLRGAYDWLGAPQGAIKRLKQFRRDFGAAKCA